MTICSPYTLNIVDGNGVAQTVPQPPPNLVSVDVNSATLLSAAQTLFAASAGLFTRIYRVHLVVDAAATLSFVDGVNVLPGKIKFAAAGSLILPAGLFPFWQGSANTDFKLASSANVQITGAVWGWQNGS